MSSLRQVGSGLLYALVSVLLVVGGLSLALAEGGFQPAASPTVAPTSLEASPTIAAPSVTLVATSETAANPTIPASATAQLVVPTDTSPLPTPTASFTARPTSTRPIYPTVRACGPYAGWIRAYVVQPHDTLFHIATLYRTTVTALKLANCRTSDTIYTGDRLWVPNVPTITPSATLVLTFPTLTEVPTEPLTLTPIPYFTDTAIPTSTPTPTPTDTATGGTGP